MLFLSHRTTDKAAGMDQRQRAVDRGYSEAQLFPRQRSGIGNRGGRGLGTGAVRSAEALPDLDRALLAELAHLALVLRGSSTRTKRPIGWCCPRCATARRPATI